MFVRNLVFYTGIRHDRLINDDHLVEFVGKNPAALIVLPVDELDRLERERRLRFERLGELRYFDEGALRAGTLLRPGTV